MTKKIKVLLLAGNTLRARAYAQQLSHLSKTSYEIKGLFFGFIDRELTPPAINEETNNYFHQKNLFQPDFQKSLQRTFTENNWHFTEVEDHDVNSHEILEEIGAIDCEIVIFAGYGGQLLKGGHFMSSKQYLHMHPGELPIERGSTTIYYSILNKRNCSVTAFYMTESIDDGNNILMNTYPVPIKGVDIDLWFDNIIRADCLMKALELIQQNKFSPENETESSEEYYVIHPVLKHVAIMSLKSHNKS